MKLFQKVKLFQNDRITMVDAISFPSQWESGQFEYVGEVSGELKAPLNSVVQIGQEFWAQDIVGEWFALTPAQCDSCDNTATTNWNGGDRLCSDCELAHLIEDWEYQEWLARS